MAPSRLTTKLPTDLCLECSTCAMFFSLSLTVSIMARFLSNSLSETLINAPFMLFLSFVINYMPSTKSIWKRFLLIYPLSATSLSKIISTNFLFSSGFLSSTSPDVAMKLSSSPFSLHIRCNLNPKSHPTRALASCSKAPECPVDMDALVLADTQGRGVYEAYAGTFAQQHLLDENCKRDGCLLFQFHETIIRDNLRKQMPEVDAYLIQIEVLQTAIARVMKQYHDSHNLGHTEATITVIGSISALFRGIHTIFFQHTAINFVKFVCHKENFCNFVGSEHAIIFCIVFRMRHDILLKFSGRTATS